MFPIPIEKLEEAQQRIAPYIHRTPLLRFHYLSARKGKEILLKCENFQKTGSFKIRGAANCILQHLSQAKKNGVVAASAGNHAQGVAAVCHQLHVASTIVMPTVTPPIKIQKTQAWGADVELSGEVYDDSYEYGFALAQKKEQLFVHPFHNADIISGQGTIGLEMLADPLFKEVQAVVVAIGGGGLISGIATAIRARRPDVKIYGVTAKQAPALWESYRNESVIEKSVNHTLADGVAVKRPDPVLFENIQKNVDGVFSLGDESIAHAISLLAEHGKMVAEGAGALPLAALLEGFIPENKVALVVSGGNIDLPALSRVLQRGLAEQDRMVRLRITSSDRPGGLLSITEVLAKSRANVLQVFHQRSAMHIAVGEADIEVDLETRGKEHTREIIQKLLDAKLKVQRVF